LFFHYDQLSDVEMMMMVQDRAILTMTDE